MVLLAKRVSASATKSICTSVSSASERCSTRSARRCNSASEGRCASPTAGPSTGRRETLAREPRVDFADLRAGLMRRSLLREGHAHANVAEACGRGAVARAHGLHGLPFAAIGRAPERPIIARADGVAAIPEFGSDAAIAGIFEHARFLTVLDLPANFRGELKMIPAIIDGPGAIGLHEDGIIGIGDEVFVSPGAGQQADIGHADDGQAIPTLGAHGAAGFLQANGYGGLAIGKIPGEEAVLDDVGAFAGHAFVVITEGSQPGAVLQARVG